VRVLVLASGEKVREAQDAGADFVGGDDCSENHGSWTDYDAVIATPTDEVRVKLGKCSGLAA